MKKNKPAKRLPPSALEAFYKIATKEANEAARKEFKTYSKAIEAIVTLRSDNDLLRGRIANLNAPKRRGRKVKYTLSMLLNGGKKVKRKGGRPKTYHNPEQRIREWDEARKRVAKKENKKTIGDLYLIRHLLNNNEKNGGAPLTREEKAAFIKQMRSTIKQWRDKTKIRIHKRKKAENPPINRAN